MDITIKDIVFLAILIVVPAISTWATAKVAINGLEQRVSRIENILDQLLKEAMSK